MATPDTTRTERVRRRSRRAPSVVALSGVAALALTVTGNAFAGGSDPLSDSSARLSDTAAQAANTAPGAAGGPADGTISGAQPNADEASSAQPPSSGEVPSPEATTQQAATALAAATQNNVQNIVIIIRINSPGNDVISQSNNAIAGAVATNTATTQQGSAASAAPLKVATAGRERARPRAAAVQRPPGDRTGDSRPTTDAEHSASTEVRAGSKSSQQYAAPPKVAPQQAVAAAPRSASAPSSREHRPLVTSVPAHIGRAAARAGTDAAHFVSSFAPSGAPAEKADSISTAVVLTLVAVMLAVLLGVGATHVPWLRARAWR